MTGHPAPRLTCALAWLAVLSACSPGDTSADLMPCGVNGACPTKYVCLGDNRCHAQAQLGGPDAAPAAPDAAVAPPDALPVSAGGAKVLVTGAAGPVAGAEVFFQDGVGAPFATATTDASGRAAHNEPGGGMVSVLVGTQLTTFVAVGPVEELWVGPPDDQSASVTLPPPAAYAGATGYAVGTCSGGAAVLPGGPTLQLGVGAGCADGTGQVTVLGTAEDDGGAALAFAVAGRAPDLPWGPWTAAQPVAVTVAHAPAGVGLELVSALTVGGVAIPAESRTMTSAPAASFPVGFGSPGAPMVDGQLFSVRAQLPPTNGLLPERRLSGLTTTTLDLADLPPAITSVTRSGLDVTWSTEAPFPEAVVAVVELVWNDANGARGWTVVMPVAPTIHLPPLPADLVAFAPPPTGVVMGLSLAALPGSNYDEYIWRLHGRSLDLAHDRPVAPFLPLRVSVARDE
jgi:hypothetical protein